MIALCAGAAALAFFRSGQLFETAVKFFYLPPHLYGIDDLLARQRRDRVIRDNPFNATVRGNQLEESQIKRYFLEPHLGAFAPAASWGSSGLPMIIAACQPAKRCFKTSPN